MYVNEEEKRIMRGLFIAINEYPKEIYTLEYSNGTIIKATVFTCYESNNGLDLDEEGYEEFNECAMRVIEIVTSGKGNVFQLGELIGINYLEYPLSIKTSSGEII